MKRRNLLQLSAAALGVSLVSAFHPTWAAPVAPKANTVLTTWYRLVLELVRHTATYSPPVASRAFAYLGVTSYEALAALDPWMTSLAGQVTGLAAGPKPGAGPHDAAAVLHAALTRASGFFFENTGPTGQRAMVALNRQISAGFADLPPDVQARSSALGLQVAEHIIDWSLTDGGAVIENMGFPMDYEPKAGPANWLPTSLIRLQQAPLLPGWGQNRTFVADGSECDLPPPPAYSEDPASDFYQQALEVYQAKVGLTDAQKAIARFWSDDPMLSPTPPGHWISIALEILIKDDIDAPRAADVLARLGVTLADAFILCWREKFRYDRLRPVTYIRRVIDPKWEPLLITPPFPEYPSGHSVQSGAAAEVLSAIFGDSFGFTDATHVDDGLAARPFASFRAAAEEAALSRMLGGIHFRAANSQGLAYGRCIGASANLLRTLS